MGDSRGLSGQKEVKLGNGNVENEGEKTYELSPKHFGIHIPRLALFCHLSITATTVILN